MEENKFIKFIPTALSDVILLSGVLAGTINVFGFFYLFAADMLFYILFGTGKIFMLAGKKQFFSFLKNQPPYLFTTWALGIWLVASSPFIFGEIAKLNLIFYLAIIFLSHIANFISSFEKIVSGQSFQKAAREHYLLFIEMFAIFAAIFTGFILMLLLSIVPGFEFLRPKIVDYQLVFPMQMLLALVAVKFLSEILLVFAKKPLK